MKTPPLRVIKSISKDELISTRDIYALKGNFYRNEKMFF